MITKGVNPSAAISCPQMWITCGQVRSFSLFMWVRELIKRINKAFGEIFPYVIHSFQSFLHTLYRPLRRVEQGVYVFSTTKPSGYYDYLYIHRSRCETNLSLNWGTP